MDLEVVGRHALFFDDDAAAAFVNSPEALVQWNSLSIDRYDVRHLLSTAPPPRKRRHHPSSPLDHYEDASLQSELDQERYFDLPSPSDEQDMENGAGPESTGGYRAVPFSYGSHNNFTNENTNDAESGFRPPFPVPESLLQNLPPSEKVHQIIARTAMFVSKHGGQSEIVLRVKQGDNPTFGFLMPDHHLHAYFRFLVDNQEHLNSKTGGKSQEENKADGNRAGGALSLLGSVYGSGEEDDVDIEDVPQHKSKESTEATDAVNVTISHGLEQNEFPGKDDVTSKHSLPSLKEKIPVIKRNCSVSTVKTGTASGLKKGDTSSFLSAGADKSQASALPGTLKVEPYFLEPPSDLKRLVDKIVEFIMRNGKEFESILIEQDTKHGRFPFLLPSNLYHPYYLSILHKAQESKLPGKGVMSQKHDSIGHGVDKKTALSKESDTRSIGSAGHDIPYDFDKKEKFKMVIGKSKKDGQDMSSKATEPNIGVSVDAEAAAAILQAATRGIKNPNIDILQRASLNGISQGSNNEVGQASSYGSHLSSQPLSSTAIPDKNGEPTVSVPVAKAIAKTAAVAAASEADSSEAYLSREQKLKAERLKRAKMFAAMIKSGAAPLKTEPTRGLSAEPSVSGISWSAAEVVNLASKEREGSSVPLDADSSEIKEKFEKKNYGVDDNERRSQRKYRSRSRRQEEDEEEKQDGEEEDKQDEEEEERDHEHSRKKRRSHHSSNHSRDRYKHRRRHSSSKDRDSRHRQKRKHKSSSDDEQLLHRHQHMHKHDSSDDEHLHRRRRYMPNNTDDEDEHQSISVKHRRRSDSEKEVELEEGEISAKSDQSKASDLDGGVSRDGKAPSQPSETTYVSNDLRAKIQAMLATL